MRRRGAAVRLKDVAGVLGVRATNGRSARIAGVMGGVEALGVVEGKGRRSEER